MLKLLKRPATNCEECGRFARYINERREDTPSSPEQADYPQWYQARGWECQCGHLTRYI